MAKKAAPAKTKKTVATKPAAKKTAAKKSAAPVHAAASKVKPAAKRPAVQKPAVKAATKAAAKTASKTTRPKAAAAPTSQAAAAHASHKPATHAHATASHKPAATHHATSHHVAGKTATHRKRNAALETTITREDGRYALPSTAHVDLPAGYKPKAGEEYMSPRQLAYFRNKLRDWRHQLVEESRQTMDNLREEVRDVGDDAERATRETENSLELRTRDRYRKLISKIDGALHRIEDGSYGFCEETDEEIGVDRLDARPIATLSLDAQERREHLRKQMGD